MADPRAKLQNLTMKFGGTSLGSADAIRQAAEITSSARAESADQVVVIASAVGGVTELLKEGTLEAASDNTRYTQIAEELRAKHAACAEFLPTTERDSALQEIDSMIERYLHFCESVRVLGEAGPRALDHTMALGERMSVQLLSSALRAVGLPAVAVDSADLIVTDDRFQDAAPDMAATREKVNEGLSPRLAKGELPVITGFL